MTTDLYIVYQGDDELRLDSLRVCGVFDSKETAIDAITKHHEIFVKDILDKAEVYGDDDNPIDYDSEWTKSKAMDILKKELEPIGRTQGYETNYMIEFTRLNESMF